MAAPCAISTSASARARDHPGDVFGELRLQRLVEGNSLGGNHVHQRPALQAGEDRGVDFLRHALVIRQDDAAARPAQGLVGGRGHDVRMRQRACVVAGGHEAGDMRHVHQQPGADRVGDGPEGGEVDHSAVGGGAGDD
jgi:hypothetical protein